MINYQTRRYMNEETKTALRNLSSNLNKELAKSIDLTEEEEMLLDVAKELIECVLNTNRIIEL